MRHNVNLTPTIREIDMQFIEGAVRDAIADAAAVGEDATAPAHARYHGIETVGDLLFYVHLLKYAAEDGAL